ncbi:MAG: hypothetical protein ACD_39C00998G0004 [uncultured bacterium]|nr:MAG: hypothetical protein ACD_39C00998G0004 [uncultured bacterium]
MKLSGREFLRSISDFFSQTNYEVEMLLLLILPFIMLVIFMFYLRSRRSSTALFDSIPAKDLEFIDTVRLQKGLEEFDRDFLLEIALTYGVKPGYIFIDAEAFTKAEHAFKIKLLEQGDSPEKNGRYQHLLKLKSKLFKTF